MGSDEAGQSSQSQHRSAWSRGDRVVHASRPEWGAGEVITAQAATIEGKPCQRLSIRFERAGLKTVSTAVATLEAAGSSGPRPSKTGSARAGVDPMPVAFEPDDAPPVQERIRALPEPATDPFRSVAVRLEETCKLYRFTDAPASIFDWAAAQTGLTDPLTAFNRHELEAEFARFRRQLDDHLLGLVRTLLKDDPRQLRAVLDRAPAEALRVAQRAVPPSGRQSSPATSQRPGQRPSQRPGRGARTPR